MGKEEPMILPSSPGAARRVRVEGWEDRHGRYFGQDEGTARWSGATHTPCDGCGTPVPKGGHARCAPCGLAADTAAYAALPRVPWDGDVVYSQARDRYYGSPGEALEGLEPGETEADLRLVACEPVLANEIGADHWADELPEGDEGELPEALEEAVAALNRAIRALPPLSWVPIGVAVKPGDEGEDGA